MKLLLGILFPFVLFLSNAAQAEEYEVLPHRGSIYGQFWISEGAALVRGGDTVGANRFRLGFDARLGQYARYLIGWRIFDLVNSAEATESVGQITRSGSGPDFGYFVIPDKLWILYSFNLGSVSGSRVTNSVSSYGHQLGVGYVITNGQNVSWSVDLNYLYSPGVTVPVYDLSTQTGGSAEYPSAQVISLGLIASFDFE